MDALVVKACEALLQHILPRLQAYLQALESLPVTMRSISADGTYLITEARELLQLLSPSMPLSKEASAPILAATAEEMSDAEAQKLLAAMDAPLQASEANSEEMSDAEAQALLAAMDAPLQSPSSQVLPAKTADDDEMREVDAETLAMLKRLEGENPIAAEPQQESKQHSLPAAQTLHKGEGFDDELVTEVEEFGASEFAADPEMIKDFITNAEELVENLDEQILQLEQEPESKEVINAIFRSAHTLKGAAGMFAFRAMERIMHRMENYFDQIAKGKQTVSSQGVDTILKAMDSVKTLLAGVKAGQPTGLKTAPMVERLNQLCAGVLSSHTPLVTELKTPENESQGALPSASEQKTAGNAANKSGQSTIRVDLQRLDALVNLVGELVIDRTRFSSIEEQIRTPGPHPQLASHMSETVQLFGRHMNEVQDIIMKVRMVPIGNAFNKFSRVVRDLAKSLGKEIDLVVEGEQTELDKTIVEEIGDPLIHLIRNAVDHGIEGPEERQTKGKKPRGRILLSARQEGNQILITIEDDGKGMDQEKIRRKAVEKGLISEDNHLSERDILNLIFEPGFSTAEKVTNLSGRGVGMDVVKRQIAKLKGVIDLASTPGQGSSITIQLPLTLAIVQSLLVKAREEIFAIPLSAVVESLRIKPSDIQKVGDAEVIRRRNRVLPLLYLHELLELEQKKEHVWYVQAEAFSSTQAPSRRAKAREERLFVVVVGTAEKRFGLVVDTLLNQQEMVIKPMGAIMADIPCVAGGAILGNGEVVLVLDIGELEGHFRNKARAHMNEREGRYAI